MPFVKASITNGLLRWAEGTFARVITSKNPILAEFMSRIIRPSQQGRQQSD
jgi:hypothetical protein